MKDDMQRPWMLLKNYACLMDITLLTTSYVELNKMIKENGCLQNPRPWDPK